MTTTLALNNTAATVVTTVTTVTTTTTTTTTTPVTPRITIDAMLKSGPKNSKPISAPKMMSALNYSWNRKAEPKGDNWYGNQEALKVFNGIPDVLVGSDSKNSYNRVNDHTEMTLKQ